MLFDTIARPYAQAIFEIAIESNSITKWKKILIFINQITSLKRIQKYLSGSISPNYLSSFFIFVGGHHFNKNVKNLIKLLAQYQRFKIFYYILKQFLKLEMSYNKINVIKLKSAYILKNNQINKIRIILEKIFASKIKFIYKIDKRILDGIIIKIHDQVFDFSIKNNLKQLSLVLNV
ncbi:ATP synthase subunit delta [Buchnera aphidicola (Protaphis terricola)]|uniref:ATP synthase F1 subunit delta n=1 Tax=Buchnera aphidicola TaxID=9 RepID=UPI003464071F